MSKYWALGRRYQRLKLYSSAIRRHRARPVPSYLFAVAMMMWGACYTGPSSVDASELLVQHATQQSTRGRDTTPEEIASALQDVLRYLAEYGTLPFPAKERVAIYDSDPMMGRRGSSNKLVLFFSADCVHCKTMFDQIVKPFADRDVEIRPIFTAFTVKAAITNALYQCGAERVAADKLADEVFRLGMERDKSPVELLAAAGLKLDPLRSCLQSTIYVDIVKRSKDIAATCGKIKCFIDGTDKARGPSLSFSTPVWIFEAGATNSESVYLQNFGVGMNDASADKLRRLLSSLPKASR